MNSLLGLLIIRIGLVLVLMTCLFSIKVATVPTDLTINTLISNSFFIADLEKKVEPKVIIWIQITPSWNVKPSQVLKVHEDASFEWTRSIDGNDPTTVTGQVSVESITKLRCALNSAAVGILTDDGGIMQARWQDDKSTEHSAEFDLMDGNAGAALLKIINKLLDSQQ